VAKEPKAAQTRTQATGKTGSLWSGGESAKKEFKKSARSASCRTASRTSPRPPFNNTRSPSRFGLAHLVLVFLRRGRVRARARARRTRHSILLSRPQTTARRTIRMKSIESAFRAGSGVESAVRALAARVLHIVVFATSRRCAQRLRPPKRPPLLFFPGRGTIYRARAWQV